MRLRELLYTIAIVPVLALTSSAQRAPQFKSEVQPVLEKNCIRCHGDGQKMGGLDLTSFAGLMAGGSSGPVIAPGKPERSLLWKMIESDKMPMGGTLGAAQKQLIRTYIEQGRFPAQDLEAATRAREQSIVTAEARSWWSFQRPVKPAQPKVRAVKLVQTPIDAFVLAKLEAKGWTLQPEADKVTLIRRAYFDLTGLLPSAPEVKAFVADSSPQAYEKLIDRLLVSPHYGEQWGRHWLDIAGYSDSRGDAGDSAREVAWKYRDYVIQAFNKNKPINQFILEQMAGDQLVNYRNGDIPAPEQVEALTATGFLRTTADITDNQTIYEVDKQFDAQSKVMETSLSAVMGLTVGCARCHDHKFDPILQKDYYKLMAVYQPVWDPENWIAANLAYGPWPSRMVLDMPQDKRDLWVKDVTSNDAKSLRRIDDLLEATYQRFRAESKNGRTLTPERRAQIRKDVETDPDLEVDRDAPQDYLPNAELEKLYPELLQWKAEVAAARANRRRKQAAVTPNFIEAAWDLSKTPSPTYILQRGNYLSPGEPVEAGLPAVLDDPGHPFQFPDPKDHAEWNHTGRRLALAKWLVAPENPLVARVFVNRVWQFHFGEGIVRSVDDFGHQGSRPDNQELLDYLAVTFQQKGWDLRWLTKEIMMSQVYRQGSREIPAYMTADPGARLLWRKPPIRLEAETIRDSMLEISGLLVDKMFGPPDPLKRGPDGQWLEDDVKGNPNRRSLYLSQARTRPVAFLHDFDAPTMTSDHQSERFRSALPSQSLALLNNPLMARVSKAFAGQLLEQSQNSYPEAVTRAFEAAYSRAPSARELAIAQEAIAAEQDPKAGLTLFLQAMFGANEFLYSY
jgi:Protein of unknown function (DUF1553)/Protein of unknown function (DUF1549)/Planctomycete cytochrome C